MDTVLYTFENIINFNRDISLFKTPEFNIKFISYGDNKLQIIFNNVLTNDQELLLLDTLNKTH